MAIWQSYDFLFFFFKVSHIELDIRMWDNSLIGGEDFGGNFKEEKWLASSWDFEDKGEMSLNLKFFETCKEVM